MNQRPYIVSALSFLSQTKRVTPNATWSERCAIQAEKGGMKNGTKRPDDAPWWEHIALYDLKHDPAEVRNVAKGHPDVVAQLAKLAIKAARAGRTNRGPARPDSSNTPQIELLEMLAKVEHSQNGG